MTFEEWKNLSTDQQTEIYKTWTPYNTENIQDLLNDILSAFRSEFTDIDILGYGNVHGTLMFAVDRPFIFDKRKSPVSFMGIPIRYGSKDPLPKEFNTYKRYVWAPGNYLAFVDSNMEEIRVKLQSPNMSREEMLNALVGMPFDDWIKQCKKWKSTDMKPGDRTLPEKPWWKVW